jgi:predicted ATPase/DNA-binding CsgD family transcriptional regulator
MPQAAHPPSKDAKERSQSQVIAFPRSPEEEPPSHNLPLELSSFVGREQEIAEVKRLLLEEDKNRLLTLTGPGGCGKTRLALTVAFEVVQNFEDGGVWWVELASLSDAHLVAQEVVSTLGVPESPGRSLTEMLVEHLKPKKKRTLLVLDNCEHLIDACAALVDTLLRACPDLTVLATSREALGVAGERVWLVPSLSLPDLERLPPIEELRRYEAVRLFVERATAAVSRFELREENAPAVVRLCRQLDGMPLAIELAAARARVLSTEQIASRLEDSFRLLVTESRMALPRQQTLQATIEWSHELLSEQEKVLFRRLSVFAGGCTLEAAEEVCVGEGIEKDEVLDLLIRLVDKSLVLVAEQQQDGAARYWLLETIRQYASEKLKESGEEPAIRRRHADFFLDLAEEAEPELKGSRQVLWVQKLSTEHDNLRAAMRWLLGEEELEQVARLGWALWLFWWIRGFFAEGWRWMEEALAKDGTMPTPARARASFAAGTMATGQADFRAAEPLLGESYELFREVGDKRGAAYALGSIGIAADGQGRHERGIALHEESADLFVEVGDRWAAATEFCFSAVGWLKRGDHGHAERLAEQGLALAREVGDKAGTSMALYVLAMVAQASGDNERARKLFEEALKLTAEVGEEANVAYCLEGLAGVAASKGAVVRAAHLWGAAEAVLEEIVATAIPHAPDPSLHERQVAAARAHLNDEEAFEAAWAEGRALTPKQAIEYALSEEEEPAPTPPSTSATTTTAPRPSYPGGLSAREAEVLKLVARGLTNAQVAQELFISPRTVNRHLNSVYAKLGVSSRAAATRFAVEHDLV